MPRENDSVKTPAHYDLNLNGVESIDVVRAENIVQGDQLAAHRRTEYMTATESLARRTHKLAELAQKQGCTHSALINHLTSHKSCKLRTAL